MVGKVNLLLITRKVCLQLLIRRKQRKKELFYLCIFIFSLLLVYKYMYIYVIYVYECINLQYRRHVGLQASMWTYMYL